jgi:hypothetical protein
VHRWKSLAASCLLLAALAAPLLSCDDGAPKPRSNANQDEARKRKVKNQFSSWDGSHKNLTRYIKDSLARPDTYEHISTTYDDRLVHLVVTTTYRAVDASGTTVKTTIKAIVDLDGNIQEIVSKGR